MMGKITTTDLPALARGAAVLGTGGGGDPHVGQLLAQQAIAQHGPVETVALGDVPDDAHVFPVGMMGAPTVMVEKLPSAGQVGAAVTALSEYLGRPATHIACIEAGGVNSTIPIVAAAQLGLPLIDADGMGRAFPELQMVLPTLGGVRATPLAISDEKGNSGVLDTVSNHWAERLARVATVEMGCSTMVSLFAMDGAQVKGSMSPATLSRCMEIGEAIEAARAVHADPVAAALTSLNGTLLATGKVVDVARRTTTGFARGEATIEGTDASADATMVLQFQNEHLIATLDGNPVATTPDLIIVLDRETGEPITTEALRYGHRVAVIAAPCDPRWHSPAGLELVGPRYFGYDTDPVPLVAGGTERP
jgi:DUF917 family protein